MTHDMMQQDLIELMEWVLTNPNDRLGPYGTTFLYGPDDWLDAAEQAQEGDFSQLRYMVKRSEQVEEYYTGVDADGLPWSEWDFADFYKVTARGAE